MVPAGMQGIGRCLVGGSTTSVYHTDIDNFYKIQLPRHSVWKPLSKLVNQAYFSLQRVSVT